MSGLDYDPEVPAGCQDADLLTAEFSRAANRANRPQDCPPPPFHDGDGTRQAPAPPAFRRGHE